MTETTSRRQAQRVKLTKSLLDEKLGVRRHRQAVIWDTEETGLSVLISRGPKHKRQATLTFRVVYYLKNTPGKPRYLKIGRYPDGAYSYTVEKKQVIVKCSDIDAVRRAASTIRDKAEIGIDPKRPVMTGEFPEMVAKYIDEQIEGNRTAAETKRIFAVYLTPEWGDKNIAEIKKGDVSELLAKISKGRIEHQGKKIGSPAMARAARADW